MRLFTTSPMLTIPRDDDGTDPVLGEHRQQVPHRRVRRDGDNLRALAAKYIADTHLALPSNGTVLMVYPPGPRAITSTCGCLAGPGHGVNLPMLGRGTGPGEAGAHGPAGRAEPAGERPVIEHRGERRG